jgi:Ser-tRNA(Ala) deacylase AlaX
MASHDAGAGIVHMVTQRLYYQDAYGTEFDASVVASTPGKEGTTRVVLDRTCFYPTSGGQPNDTGMLDSQPVFDVLEQDGAWRANCRA